MEQLIEAEPVVCRRPRVAVSVGEGLPLCLIAADRAIRHSMCGRCVVDAVPTSTTALEFSFA
jgi:hypothetical protein